MKQAVALVTALEPGEGKKIVLSPEHILSNAHKSSSEEEAFED